MREINHGVRLPRQGLGHGDGMEIWQFKSIISIKKLDDSVAHYTVI